MKCQGVGIEVSDIIHPLDDLMEVVIVRGSYLARVFEHTIKVFDESSQPHRSDFYIRFGWGSYRVVGNEVIVGVYPKGQKSVFNTIVMNLT
jgi:hypothetical protein